MLWIAIVILGSGTLPSVARAFSFEEHERLGHDAYLHACYILFRNGDPQKLPSYQEQSAAMQGEWRARLELACPSDTSLRRDLARVFGQAVALSGDHVETPGELGTIEGMRSSLSLVSYAKLGLKNSSHFHPSGPAQWAQYHNEALALAMVSQQARQERTQFEDVLRRLAFGEHFLQDAFAAGHMGFNRPATSPVASLLYHDVYSREGRVVASRAGTLLSVDAARGGRDEWVTYGDYHLCEADHSLAGCTTDHFEDAAAFNQCICAKPCDDPTHTSGHRDAHFRVHAAATTALLEVLYAFVTKRPEKSEGWDWAPTRNTRDDRPAAAVIDLLKRPPERQLPSAYGTDDTNTRPCPFTFNGKRQYIALDAISKRATVWFAPVIAMRWAAGLTGRDDGYGYWMPTLGFSILYAELSLGWATPAPFREPRLWHREWSSLYMRLIGETPGVNLFGTPLTISVVAGLVDEVCMQNCRAARRENVNLVGLTAGPKLSIEALSTIVALSLEPFLLWNRDGEVTFGFGFGLSVAKPILARGVIHGGGRYLGPD